MLPLEQSFEPKPLSERGRRIGEAYHSRAFSYCIRIFVIALERASYQAVFLVSEIPPATFLQLAKLTPLFEGSDLMPPGGGVPPEKAPGFTGARGKQWRRLCMPRARARGSTDAGAANSPENAPTIELPRALPNKNYPDLVTATGCRHCSMRENARIVYRFTIPPPRFKRAVLLLVISTDVGYTRNPLGIVLRYNCRD